MGKFKGKGKGSGSGSGSGMNGRKEKSNRSKLLHGQRVYTKKRQAKAAQVAEISWDGDNRKEYLTGFHKRKKEQHKLKVEAAKQRDKAAQLELQREVRDQRKQMIADKIRENEEYYAPQSATGDGLDASNSDSGSESGSGSDSDSNSASDGEVEGGEGGSVGESSTKKRKRKCKGNKENKTVLKSKKFVTTISVIDDFDIAAAESDENGGGLEHLLTPKQIISKLRK